MKCKWLISLALVGLMSVSVLSAQNSNDPKTVKKIAKLMEKATKALEKKDGRKAMENLDEVLALHPTYAPALHQKARLTFAQDPAAAQALLEKAVEADPNYAGAINDLARLLYQGARKAQQDNPDAATGLFLRAAHVTNLQNVEKGLMINALYNAAVMNHQKQAFEPSVKILEELVAVPGAQAADEASFRMAHYMLGVAYARLNNQAKAISYLRQYIPLAEKTENDPYLPISRYLVADGLMQELNGKVEAIKADKEQDKRERISAAAAACPEIKTLLEQALAGKPDLEDARMGLGNYAYHCGNLDEAIQIYEGLIRDFPQSGNQSAYQSFLKDIRKEKDELAAQARKKGSARR